MLVIRDAQLAALSRSVTEKMIDAAVEFVRSGFPEPFGRIGEASVRESVLLAMRKAEFKRW